MDISNLQVFGCPAFAHVKKGELAPRVVKCLFLSCASEPKGYRLWYPDLSKIILSRDIVVFWKRVFCIISWYR